MPTEEELLDAIDAAPDEDAPRLGHADWLEAHGDAERAAYLRRNLSTECEGHHIAYPPLVPPVGGHAGLLLRGVVLLAQAAGELPWPRRGGPGRGVQGGRGGPTRRRQPDGLTQAGDGVAGPAACSQFRSRGRGGRESRA